MRLPDRHGLGRWECVLDKDVRELYIYSPIGEYSLAEYRYAYLRWWDSTRPIDLWIGTNPGKADSEQRARPTIARCVNRSKNWGSGGFIFANLFALRANKPREMRSSSDPIGPLNDEALRIATEISRKTIAVWGNWGRFMRRADEVLKNLRSPVCFGLTAAGHPRHPLSTSKSATLCDLNGQTVSGHY
jgi:hypothetical protein